MMTSVRRGHNTSLYALAPTVIVTLLQLFVHGSCQSSNDNSQSGANVDNSITFDLPLTVSMKTEDGGEYQLTAFRSKNNDAILEEVRRGETRNVPRLRWVSFGRPRFVRSFALQQISQLAKESNETKKFFHFTPSGFYTKVQMLTDVQKALLARQASVENHLNITSEQITNLPLNKFECSLIFRKADGMRDLIKGTVGDFGTFPLRMDFDAPNGTNEREQVVRVHVEDLKFNCHMSMNAKVTRTNSLVITSEQLQDINLEDKLFGDSTGGGTNEVYVTRHQMSTLAAEMYSTLGILEEYEMPESAFSSAFVDEIIRQLATQHFTQVPVDAVLASLSAYSLDFSGDLTADRIQSDFGNTLKIEQFGEKSRIVAARSRDTSSEESMSASGGVSVEASADAMGLVKASAKSALNFAYENARKSTEQTKSLDDQLRELNHMSRDEAEWKIEGDKVIPKSLNVAKLSRSRIGNKLNFTRIRRQTMDAAFKHDFTMYLVADQPSEADSPIRCRNSSETEIPLSFRIQLHRQLASISSMLQSLKVQKPVLADQECLTTPDGVGYKGYVSYTESGRTCQRWTHQYPHQHQQTDPDRYPDKTISDAANYCRNPDNSERPWCYTTDSEKRWEYCDIPVCIGRQCPTDDGADYIGSVSKTESGRTCQQWTHQYPHKHSYTDASSFPDRTLTDAANYCRNPGGDSDRPWCYTTDGEKRWEYCDIPMCRGQYFNLIFANRPAAQGYQLLSINRRLSSLRHSLVVYIKAEHDGIVILSASNNLDDGQQYEIVICGGSGHNQFIIKKPKLTGVKTIVTSSYKLNANEYRPFWISWKGGHVRVGRGTIVGSSLEVQWKDPSSHPVNYLGVGSWGAAVSFVFQYD